MPCVDKKQNWIWRQYTYRRHGFLNWTQPLLVSILLHLTLHIEHTCNMYMYMYVQDCKRNQLHYMYIYLSLSTNSTINNPQLHTTILCPLRSTMNIWCRTSCTCRRNRCNCTCKCTYTCTKKVLIGSQCNYILWCSWVLLEVVYSAQIRRWWWTWVVLAGVASLQLLLSAHLQPLVTDYCPRLQRTSQLNSRIIMCIQN